MATPLQVLQKKRSEAVRRMVEEGYLARFRVYVGHATCEIAAGSGEVWDIFQEAVRSGRLKDVYLSAKGCAGRCNLEPMVEIIEKDKMPVKYCKVTPKRAREIIERHLLGGEVITAWTIK